jgi:hypothetical protein
MSGEGDKGSAGDGAAAEFDSAAFYSSLSGEDRDFADRKGLTKLDDKGKPASPLVALQGWSAAEKLIGTNRIPEPRLDSPEELAKWPGFEKLGTPKEAKDYTFKRPDMPEGVAYDEAAETRFREMAHKAHMPQFMFERIMTEEMASRMASAKQASDAKAAERTRIETVLRKDHGAGYDQVMKQAGMAAQYAAEQAGIDPGKTSDYASAILGSEETARLFIWLGQALGEGTLKGAENKGFAPSVSDARAELERLNTDTAHQAAFNDKTHVGHAEAVNRVERLNKTIHG